MPADPQLEAALRQWAAAARERLMTLTEAVTLLRGAATQTATETRDDVASEVLAASTALVDWLHMSRAPRGLRKAEGELGASAGVYRNAAVAYGSLSDADPHQYEARLAACLKLLEQGDHHVEIAVSLLHKKLGTS